MAAQEGRRRVSFGQGQAIWGGGFAPESQTLIASSADPETIDDPSGEKATEVIDMLCAFVFSILRSSVAAQEGRRRQFWPTECDLAEATPESQTLIVLSYDPETIDAPSGEKATEAMALLCAFVFSVLSSSVAAREGRRRQFWPREGDSGGRPT